MDAEGVPIWYIFNESVMCSPDQPERVLIKTVDMRHMIAYVPERKAIRKVRTYGAIGRCNCSACNWAIEQYDRFCRRCGAELVGTERERIGDG